MATFGCMTPGLPWQLAGLLVILGFPAMATAQRTVAPRDTVTTPPAFLLGTFSDDYDGRYTITSQLWQHGSRARYRVLKWNVSAQYLIAHNDANNPSEMGLYTRIDWMRLDMAPYTWAFCMTAYKAPSADSAEATQTAKREAPRTGCSGFPFSRMKPVQP
jgi:hypothetical protein